MTQKTFGSRSGSNAAKRTSFPGGTLQRVALRTQKSNISQGSILLAAEVLETNIQMLESSSQKCVRITIRMT